MAAPSPTSPSRLRRLLVLGALVLVAGAAILGDLALHGHLPYPGSPRPAMSDTSPTLPAFVEAVRVLETPAVHVESYAYLANHGVTLEFLQELEALGLHGLTPAELVAVQAYLYSPTFFTTYEAIDASPEALRALVRHQLAAMGP